MKIATRKGSYQVLQKQEQRRQPWPEPPCPLWSARSCPVIIITAVIITIITANSITAIIIIITIFVIGNCNKDIVPCMKCASGQFVLVSFLINFVFSLSFTFARLPRCNLSEVQLSSQDV